MKHYLKYGKKLISVSIKGKYLGKIKAKMVENNINEKDIIKTVVNRKLSSFISSSDKIGIIIPDSTRTAGVKVYLPVILSKLHKLGVNNSRVLIIIATGSHKVLHPEAIKDLVGNRIFKKYKIICNKSNAHKQFYYGGKTKAGTEVFINKAVKNIDKIIATSSVLYHYFAGFGGGPKILMPGIVRDSTIEQNHKRTLSVNGEMVKNCRNGNINNNPVYKDIVDSIRFFPKTLYIGTILNEEGKIIKCFCGDIIKAHKKAAEFIRSIYDVSIPKKADVVICSAGGAPKDINLVQSHKSIHNAFNAVNVNGVILCLFECKEGIGSKTFLKFFKYSSIDELKKNILKDYSLNGQTALSLWSKALKCKIILLSKLKETAELKNHGIEIVKNKNSALNLLKKYTNNKFDYYVIPSANSLNIRIYK